MKRPIKEFQFTHSRSSGAGGQNINKVNTKVTLSWKFSQSDFITSKTKKRLRELYPKRINSNSLLTISSQRFRDQSRNIADCLEKLDEMLTKAKLLPKVRKKTAPTKNSREKRLKEKKVQAHKKKIRQDKPEY